MLTKEILMKEFRKDAEKYWKVQMFDEKGFQRKQCHPCSAFFWTLDQQRNK